MRPLPRAISVWQGSLWVADTLNFRLQQFALQSGELVASFGRLGAASGEMPRLKGLDVDADGTLWISDAYLDEVALYDTDGTFLTALGGSGAGPGEFSFPAGIAAHPDGRIAVVDSLNRRLQIFRLLSPGSAPGSRRSCPGGWRRRPGPRSGCPPGAGPRRRPRPRHPRCERPGRRWHPLPRPRRDRPTCRRLLP